MTIDEAMTDLSIQLEVKRRLMQDRQADALVLGIEALKRVRDMRLFDDVAAWENLPGETEK